jgi:hypothetical protein
MCILSGPRELINAETIISANGKGFSMPWKVTATLIFLSPFAGLWLGCAVHQARALALAIRAAGERPESHP